MSTINFERLKDLLKAVIVPEVYNSDKCLHTILYCHNNEDFLIKGVNVKGSILSHCSLVWPNEWKHLPPNTKDKSVYEESLVSYCLNWFGLSLEMYNHLFVPLMQQPEKFGGMPRLLDNWESPSTMAAQLHFFIKKCEKI